MSRTLTAPCHKITSRLREAAGEQGSALVEFGVVLTVVFLLMFGIMDFSRAVYSYHFISEAAREATRYAAVRGSTFGTACSNPQPVAYKCEAAAGDVKALVQSLVPAGMHVTSTNASCGTPSAGQLNVCTSWPGTAPTGATGACPATPAGGENPGCLVKVQLQYTYGFTLPFVSRDASNITMTSTSETVIQQ